jgi:hypothetical protein
VVSDKLCEIIMDLYWKIRSETPESKPSRLKAARLTFDTSTTADNLDECGEAFGYHQR